MCHERDSAPSANQPQHTAGTQHHTGLATAETIAGGSIAVGRVLIVPALLALAAWVMTR